MTISLNSIKGGFRIQHPLKRTAFMSGNLKKKQRPKIEKRVSDLL